VERAVDGLTKMSPSTWPGDKKAVARVERQDLDECSAT
jgi:hypothetical protein